ncbi:hypothetical protein Tco_0042105 [Tanacetum coccineum]
MMMLILRGRIVQSDKRHRRNQEKNDDFDFWTDSCASDDDEIPSKQVSQEIMEEVSLTIDEDKLRKMDDKMLRQRCTSGDEHQYHIDQMKNFLKSDIVWESRKEILVFPYPQKTSKKEKRVMRHTKIHKFCDATLNRVLEGLKSYNIDVKYGYVQKDLTKDET